MRKQALLVLLDTTHMDMGDSRTYSTELNCTPNHTGRGRQRSGRPPVSCHAHARVPAAAFNNDRPALRSVSIFPLRPDADGGRESDSDGAKGPEARRTHSAQAAHNRQRPLRMATAHGADFGSAVSACLRAADCGAGQHAKNDSSTRNTRSGKARHVRPRSASTRRRNQRRMNGGSGQKAFPSFAPVTGDGSDGIGALTCSCRHGRWSRGPALGLLARRRSRMGYRP
jgi:hypothetical protein